MKKLIVILAFPIFFIVGCTKNITQVYPSTTNILKDSLVVRDTVIIKDTTKQTSTTSIPPIPSNIVSLPGNANDSISFNQSKNVLYILAPSNKTGRILLWLNCANAVVGTTVNIYVFSSLGTLPSLWVNGYGQCFSLNSPNNPNALEWYYQVTFMGNFNGENIFNYSVFTN